MGVEIKEKKVLAREDFPFQWEVEENTWIPMSDGANLAARIWYPKVDEPVSVVLEYIPYHKRDGMRGRDEPMHGYFAGNGFAVVRCDMRGTGESDGIMEDEYLKQEQDDALEVIDWISKQPWCNGNVGMMGKSWGGFNSLQVAARRPPALRAVMVVGFTDDRFNNDIHYKGGCLLNDNFWWGAIMQAYQTRPQDPEIVGDRWKEDWLKRMNEMPLFAANWTEHQTKDAYWKHGSVSEDYSDIQVPVFAIDGWADSYTNTVLSLMNGLDVPRKALIGPWAHVYAHDGSPLPSMGFLQEATKWWKHWLNGEETDTLAGPMIEAWMEEPRLPDCVKLVSEGRWVGLDQWPSKDVATKEYSMTFGKLQEVPNEKEEIVELNTPQNHGLLAGEWMGAAVPGETCADTRIDDGMCMVFNSDVLTEDMEVLGYPTFEVELSSDKPKAMLFAQLADVDPSGAVTRVSYGVMNLTHLDGHDQVTLLEPGKKVKASVLLDVCGQRFAAGHRIRLSLATTFWPMFWSMPEDATLTLDLSTAKFNIPVYTGQDSAGPNMNPECAPLTPMTTLKGGYVDRSVSYDILKDEWTCITDGVGGVFGEGVYRFDDIDITIEHNLKRELTLSNKDPLSAKYRITQKLITGREGWLIDADYDLNQTADMDNFYLDGVVHITLNGEEIFDKTYHHAIPRNGM
ncbi:MAG: CocE/NonD family hydrolase [Eubacteriales bacterium]